MNTHQTAQPPPYTSNAQTVQHRYPISDKSGKQWGMLTFASGARSTNSIPRFYEDDIIHGIVDVDKIDSIRTVTIKVAGSVITGPMADERTTFWKYSTCLWTRKTAPADVGNRVCSFSIPIPTEVCLKGNPETFRLPETFLERHTRVTVLYELSVTLSRGMFRPDIYFQTRFRYMPCTRPSAPSPLRQRAYRLGEPLRGPRHDPAGWKTTPTVMAHGYVFRTRSAVVHCALSLARPLSYTRGSVIPCWITLASEDPEALEFFATPDAMVLHLRRCVRSRNLSPMALNDVDESFTTVGLASWWARPEYDSNEFTRTLEGELSVPADLVSSSALSMFSISYTVELSAPNSLGFTPLDGNALITVPVVVATMHAADAPRPVVYAPPSYDTFTPHDESSPTVLREVYPHVSRSGRA
ncbi:hypothetical protein MSAN_01306100 [Mycena sanguinolenta]|uniref:Arrestin-like N-terminal domain-containing protein n=1 Tax=Mycena sanguinolenta TaxID=230812 RepID=A0A8H6Y9Z0_9AGAR|nr:hypothetical protein MSAN_01306100 [Mycena sanguinolenta]